jgi:hypothetical protein
MFRIESTYTNEFRGTKSFAPQGLLYIALPTQPKHSLNSVENNDAQSRRNRKYKRYRMTA